VLVSLTPAGRDLEDRIPEMQAGARQATGLTDDEIAHLREVLQSLTTTLRASRAGVGVSP
jgi:DNA-binding MarR family transcriptional regulator